MGAVLGALYIVYGIYLIVQRKRYPVDNPQLDKQAVDNFKSGISGLGIVLALITAGFLIAFGIVAIMV